MRLFRSLLKLALVKAFLISFVGSFAYAGTCTTVQWNSQSVYTGGKLVQYDKMEFKAKWWTQGQTPDKNNQWGVWEYIQDCNGGTEPDPDPAVVARRPFPQAVNRAGIKPSHVTAKQMNDAVSGYYTYWKQKYVKESNGVTPGGGYYVEMVGNGSGAEVSKTTSEAHGYGMITFALMAGFDKDAKKYFDGMFNMFDKHRSTSNQYNMSWLIHKTEQTYGDSNSATDGDMDIAYSLLLAHYQWDSTGDINYLAEAKAIINNGIKVSDVNVNKRTSLGDWDRDPWNTRSSDWMAGHMRAYQHATGDIFWSQTADTIYSLIDSITTNHSSTTGLVPDFVINEVPTPAPYNYLDEGLVDYSWNACRYPLRIAMDFGHYETPEAKAAMNKLLGWLKTAAPSPSQIKAGYYLNGTPQVSYSSAAFTAPLIAAATVDAAHQQYLNDGWNALISTKYDYYSDSINLLSMLYISGNWWKAE